jgi:Tfp pilus assembly protein PilN
VSQQINLFNPAFRRQKKYVSAITIVQVLGVILLAGVALAYYTSHQVAELDRQAASSSARLSAMQAQLAGLKNSAGVRQKSKALEDALQKAEVELKSLQQVAEVLKKGEFGNAGGYVEYFRAFARRIDSGIWLTGLDIESGGAEIGLQGRALQADLIPAYLSRLKKEPVLQGKSFAVLEMRSETVKPAKAEAASAAYVEFELKSAGMVAKRAETPGAGK